MTQFGGMYFQLMSATVSLKISLKYPQIVLSKNSKIEKNAPPFVKDKISHLHNNKKKDLLYIEGG